MFKYSWCWYCDCATINSPDDKENTCCAFWGSDAAWYEQVRRFIKENPGPDAPSQKDVDNWVKRIFEPWSEEDKLICAIFGTHKLDESEYYFVRQWADKVGLRLLTLQQLSEKSGEEINYDCKTGYEWNEEEKTHVNIIEPTGWLGDSYVTERIPRRIYTRRRKQSECDYTGHISFLKNLEEIQYPIAYEAQEGQKIHVLHGSCKDQIVTVVLRDCTDTMMKVKREGAEHCNLICKITPANVV